MSWMNLSFYMKILTKLASLVKNNFNLMMEDVDYSIPL